MGAGGTGFQPVSGLSAAGGIGGLLAADVDAANLSTTGSGDFWFCYDANGIVSQLVAGDAGYGGGGIPDAPIDMKPPRAVLVRLP